MTDPQKGTRNGSLNYQSKNIL